MSRTPRFFYGQDPETEHLELGARVAYAYDELHEIAYRLGAAAGIPRAQVPLEWQRRLSTARREGDGLALPWTGQATR